MSKKIKVVCVGLVASREMYLPDCEITNLVKDLWREKKSHFIFEDMSVFKSHGYQIYYSGVKSPTLKLVGAIYQEKKEE